MRQDGVGGAEVTVQLAVLEPHSCGQRVDTTVFVILLGCVGIIDDLDNPKIILVANGKITIPRDFPALLGDWRSDSVRVHVPSSLGMHESDLIAVLQEPNRSVWINRISAPRRYDLPVVILVLVVITRDLLLETSHGQSLHVRMQ